MQGARVAACRARKGEMMSEERALFELVGMSEEELEEYLGMAERVLVDVEELKLASRAAFFLRGVGRVLGPLGRLGLKVAEWFDNYGVERAIKRYRAYATERMPPEVICVLLDNHKTQMMGNVHRVEAAVKDLIHNLQLDKARATGRVESLLQRGLR